MEAFCVFLYYFVSNNIENLIVNVLPHILQGYSSIAGKLFGGDKLMRSFA